MEDPDVASDTEDEAEEPVLTAPAESGGGSVHFPMPLHPALNQFLRAQNNEQLVKVVQPEGSKAVQALQTASMEEWLPRLVRHVGRHGQIAMHAAMADLFKLAYCHLCRDLKALDEFDTDQQQHQHWPGRRCKACRDRPNNPRQVSGEECIVWCTACRNHHCPT